MSAGDKLSIFLRDCRIALSVGIYPVEQQAPQTVIVHVTAETALTHRFDDAGEDTTHRTVSYEGLYHFVTRDLAKLGHIYLLESVAERIIDFCFEDVRLHTVHVRLEKPDILPGSVVGIEMTRTRKG